MKMPQYNVINKIILTIIFTIACTSLIRMSIIGSIDHNFLTFFILSHLMVIYPFIYRRKSFLSIFLSLFLYLGFYTKYVFFQTDSILFGEPFGSFDFSKNSWIEVLNYSSAGFLAIISAQLVVGYINIPFNNMTIYHVLSNFKLKKSIVNFYDSQKKLLYIIAILIILCAWNLHYKIYIVGLKSDHFILSLLFNIFLNYISPLSIALICDQLIKSNSKISLILALPLIESFLTNSSKLSRGFIFHTVPYIFTNFQFNFQKKTIITYCFIIICCIFMNAKITTYLRKEIYLPMVSESKTKEKITDYYNSSIMNIVKNLFVKRWIGLEGVMASQSITYSTSVDLQNIKYSYESLISKSGYVDTNNKNINFGSIPGPIGVATLFKSKMYVFFFLLIISILIFLIEKLLYSFGDIPFVMSFFGAKSALLFSQATFSLSNFFIHFFFCSFFALILIHLFSFKSDTVKEESN